MPAIQIALIALLGLGALGLFLALPGGRVGIGRIGLLLLAAAGAALATMTTWLASGESTLVWFIGCALVGLFAAVRVITHKKPVYSALYFVLLLLAVAGLLLLMQAEFLAFALIIVYAGAILVTYAFVIMLAQQSRQAPYDINAREPAWGVLAGFVLATIIAGRLFAPPDTFIAAADAVDFAGTVEVVGTRLLTHYVIGIQIVGVLLLAAMVGAIAIARRKITADPSGGEVD